MQTGVVREYEVPGNRGDIADILFHRRFSR